MAAIAGLEWDALPLCRLVCRVTGRFIRWATCLAFPRFLLRNTGSVHFTLSRLTSIFVGLLWFRDSFTFLCCSVHEAHM